MTELLQALAEPVTSPTSRTWWPFLAGAAILALLLGRGSITQRLGLPLWRTPSARLDVQLLVVRQLLVFIGLVPRVGAAFALATTLARLLDAHVGRPELTPPPGLAIAYTLVLFVAWDLSRYALHRLLHEVPWLWRFHRVHHTAEVLTPLTFFRVHPVEALLYEVRGVLVTGVIAGTAFWLWRGSAVALTVLGVDAVGFVLSGLTGNLRHSHVWLRFGPTLEKWLLSPAQHQLHHAFPGLNYGVWLATWDRLGGTLRIADQPPERVGLGPSDHDLLRALAGR